MSIPAQPYRWAVAEGHATAEPFTYRQTSTTYDDQDNAVNHSATWPASPSTTAAVWAARRQPLTRQGMPVFWYEDEGGDRPVVAMNRCLRDLPVSGARARMSPPGGRWLPCERDRRPRGSGIGGSVFVSRPQTSIPSRPRPRR